MVRVVAPRKAQWDWRGVVTGKRIEVGAGSMRFRPLRAAREVAFEHTRMARLRGDPKATVALGFPEGHPLDGAAGGGRPDRVPVRLPRLRRGNQDGAAWRDDRNQDPRQNIAELPLSVAHSSGVFCEASPPNSP